MSRVNDNLNRAVNSTRIVFNAEETDSFSVGLYEIIDWS